MNLYKSRGRDMGMETKITRLIFLPPGIWHVKNFQVLENGTRPGSVNRVDYRVEDSPYIRADMNEFVENIPDHVAFDCYIPSVRFFFTCQKIKRASREMEDEYCNDDLDGNFIRYDDVDDSFNDVLVKEPGFDGLFFMPLD